MTRFLTRTLTATLCMLILVLPAMATDTPVNNNDFGQTNNSGNEPLDGPQIVSGLASNPTGGNLGIQAGGGGAIIAEPPITYDQNFEQAMETQFDQGTIDCECSGTFEVGDRVVALVDNPAGAAGILAGHEGWVMCGGSGTPDILVSWDGWLSGHDGNNYCLCPTITALPQTSGWYVDCDEIAVLPSVPVDCICSGDWSTGARVTAAVDNPQGAPGILAGDKGTVVGGVPTGFPNLFISWDNWTSGHTGGIAGCPGVTLPNNSGWYVDCPDVLPESDVACACGGDYQTGDRVTATVSNPQFATDIMQGRGGTVVCGYSVAGGLPILIQWDDWQLGHNGNGFCACPVTSLPDNSGWWHECVQVTPSVNVSCACGGIYNTGDRVEALVANPTGQPDVPLGHKGTVISGSTALGSSTILISWDGVTSGHDGNGFADCPVVTLDNTSGWWVNCAEIAPIGSGGPTIAVALDATPDSGTAPFTTIFTAELANLTTENRRAAAKINIVIASGSQFTNWRAGWTNLSSMEILAQSWGLNIPDLPTLIGTNTFTIIGEDVTPAPFNQPPYEPSGDTDSDVATVIAN